MLTQEQRDKATLTAVKMATLDFETNGNYSNAPYTVTVDDVRLKARIRHRRDRGEMIASIELYQPETHVSFQELSRTKLNDGTENLK